MSIFPVCVYYALFLTGELKFKRCYFHSNSTKILDNINSAQRQSLTHTID